MRQPNTVSTMRRNITIQEIYSGADELVPDLPSHQTPRGWLTEKRKTPGLIKLIEILMSYVSMQRMAGLLSTHRVAITDWARDCPDLAAAIARGRVARMEMMVDDIVDIADDSTDDVLERTIVRHRYVIDDEGTERLLYREHETRSDPNAVAVARAKLRIDTRRAHIETQARQMHDREEGAEAEMLDEMRNSGGNSPQDRLAKLAERIERAADDEIDE